MSYGLYDHPEEQRLVGTILTSYGDLEYMLATCLGAVLNDRAAAIRSLFRLRGGNVRIQVADALLRPRMDAIGLKDAYDATLGALRYSTKIRNQYAHCHWYDGGEGFGIFFTDLQNAADTAIGSLSYAMRHVDLALLRLQDDYLQYAIAWLSFLAKEFEMRAGRSTSHDREAPKITDQPPLHNPIAEHPLPGRVKDTPPPPEGLLPEDQP